MYAIPDELRPPPHKSWNMVLAELPDAERQAFLAALSENQTIALANDWFLSARREQMAPNWDWFIWLFLAGRGAGKNYSASNWLIEQHQQKLAKNSFIVAATSSDLRRFCLEGPSGILQLAPKWFYPEYQPSKAKLVWPDGAETLLYSAEEPDRLRGPNHDIGWADELAAWAPKPDATWEMLMFTMRFGKNPKVVVTTTPRPIPLLKELLSRENKDVAITRATTYDNRENLSKIFIDTVIKPYEGTRIGRQELMGEVLFDVEGALWSYEQLEACRRIPIPLDDFLRIGIAVDPAVSAESGSDETGIVSGGSYRGDGKQIFAQIIGDHSMKQASPEAWGKKVVQLYHDLQADFVVAEKNNGGDLVARNIQAIDPTVPVKLVHATRAKTVRAEPVATLYERGLVSHAKTAKLEKLEDQLCQMAPGKRKKSPDRADALVWLLTELLLGGVKKKAGTFGR